MIKIKRTDCNFEQEPFKVPFGFKSGYLNNIWQIAAFMESESGHKAVGLGVQSVLWSDARIFNSFSQAAGNCTMLLITEYALQKSKELAFETPLDLLDQLLPIVFEYGKKITCNNRLRMTFILNALVAVDNAAWLLYCRKNGIIEFDKMIPGNIRSSLTFRNDRLASIPVVAYGATLDEVEKMVDEGYFFFKIKIGSNPEGDNDLDKMLEWDKHRLSSIHEAVKKIETSYTESGHIPYYLDANGQYDTKERLMRFLDHADKIGALDRIVLLEEPFSENYHVDVSDIPVRLAVDESAHSDKDVVELIERGYRAIALKPIAKTLSMSFKICKAAFEKGIPCYCADLTVNPIMVDWNKNVAARLAPLPGLKIGLLESNGCQNYRRWGELKTYHPCYGSGWMETVDGLFYLNEDFYHHSGGIYYESGHYCSLVKY